MPVLKAARPSSRPRVSYSIYMCAEPNFDLCYVQADCTKVSAASISSCPAKLHSHIRPPVEYAMEAISHAGIVIGVLSKDGVVLAAEKKVTGKLLDMSGATGGSYGGSGEKIFLLNSCVPPPPRHYFCL